MTPGAGLSEQVVRNAQQGPAGGATDVVLSQGASLPRPARVPDLTDGTSDQGSKGRAAAQMRKQARDAVGDGPRGILHQPEAEETVQLVKSAGCDPIGRPLWTAEGQGPRAGERRPLSPHLVSTRQKHTLTHVCTRLRPR